MRIIGIQTKLVRKFFMEKPNEELSGRVMKIFLKRHWKMMIVIAGVIAGAVIAALFVFLWVVADAQATALVPAMLGQWTVGYFVIFILNLILWEVVFVGIWGIPIAVIIYSLWYKKLPEEELKEYRGEPKKRQPMGAASGIIPFIIILTWLIMVWINGTINLAFQAWTFNEFIFSWLHAIAWDLLIIGVPLAIGIISWIIYVMKKEP
jgi:hypothetical protein